MRSTPIAMVAFALLTACGSKEETPPPPDTGPACIGFDAGPRGADVEFPDTTIDEDAEVGPVDAGRTVTRTQIDDIFKKSCSYSSCHGTKPGPGGLYLPDPSVSNWYVNLVNVPSTENPKMKRIVPRDPQNSWIVHKIAADFCVFLADCVAPDGGSDAAADKCGQRMPAEAPALSQVDRDRLIQWIREGANEL